MNTEKINQPLYAISEIYTAAKGNQFSGSVTEEYGKELQLLSEKLGIGTESAFIFSLIFTQNMENDSVGYSSIGKYLKINVVEVMARSVSFEELKETGLIEEKRRRGRFNRGNVEFIVPDSVQEAILNNRLPFVKEEPEIKSSLDILERISDLIDECGDEEISPVELFIQTNAWLDEFEHFPLLGKVKKLRLSDFEKAIFFDVLWNSITGSESTSMSRTVEAFIRSVSARVKFCQRLVSGDTKLLKLNLIELEKANFFNDSGLKLGEPGFKMLEEEGVKLAEVDQKDVLDHKVIKEKTLFYNEQEHSNLAMLSRTFEIQRFKEVQQILEAKALPIGVNCIFYGPPGTGKTEGVLQLARETGRDIVRVDISETKSKWFGDSEKLIKKVFTRYQKLYDIKEVAPILLFNEADAILSKRTGNSEQGVDQTRNAIQNILLEELENFKGIFIATTNLIDNLDAAFERRFLFKIEIKRPGIAARQKIWQSKIDFLSPEHCLELAQQFDFSGGEIENITRKILMHEIINAEKIDFKAILELCRQEKFETSSESKVEEKKTTILGFQKYKNEDPYLA